jgi:hypothetical protein
MTKRGRNDNPDAYAGPVTPEAYARVDELLAGLLPSFGVLRERLARAIAEPVGLPAPSRDAVWVVVATPDTALTGWAPASAFSRPLDGSSYDRTLRAHAGRLLEKFFTVLPLVQALAGGVPLAVADLVRAHFPAGDFFYGKPVHAGSGRMLGVFVLHDGAGQAALAFQPIGSLGLAAPGAA